MRRAKVLGLMILMTFVGGTALAADGNVNFIIGQRTLGDDFWEFLNMDTQPAFGVNADFGGDSWPVHIAVGINLSADSGDIVDVAVADLSFGALWVPRKGKLIRPFLGVGISSVGVAIDDGFSDDTDRSFGYYLNGGVYFRLAGHFNIGVDVRVLDGTSFEMFSGDFNSDYAQAGMILGVGW